MIYTLGYNAWSHDAIVAKIAELDAWLVDVRYSARSARAAFDEVDLRAVFPTYVRVRELGNKAFREGRIELLDLPRGIERISGLLAARPVVMICACRNIESCHRRVAAEKVGAALGLPVVHIAPSPPPPPRQTSLW